MDIHRCRFVPYPASEINALAFSHPSNAQQKTPPTLRLAVGRSSGDIEIWNPLNGLWVQETILRGGKDRGIEGLVWTHDLDGEDGEGKRTAGRLRLFSIGHSNVVTEWDLALGKPVRHSGGNYGEVWCMAAQPRYSKEPGDDKQEQLIALGCADGTIVLHSTADGDLSYLRSLTRGSGKKPRVLSLAWQGRRKIVAGYSDSTIRVHEIREKGLVLANMSLGAGRKGGPSAILVWAVRCFGNDIILSGDSTGELKIWDASKYALLQRIQTHKADILDLALGADGSTMMSGGMDRRTTLYHRDRQPTTGGKGRWAEVTHQRIHQNDVKTMAAFESQQMSVVVSGGPDATLMVTPLRSFGQENPRSLSHLPKYPPVQSAPAKRLLMSWWGRAVSIWQVHDRACETASDEEGRYITKSRTLVANIALQGEENITSASISRNGNLLAVSTISSTKIFSLRARRSTPGLRVHKLDGPRSFSSRGARLVEFSPDGSWLAVTALDSRIALIRMVDDAGSKHGRRCLNTEVALEHRAKSSKGTKAQHGTHDGYHKTITRLAWSSDSRILAAGDVSGNLDSWLLEGHEDPTQKVKEEGSAGEDDSNEEDSEAEERTQVVFGQRWTRNTKHLAKLPSAPLVLSFRPAKKTRTSAGATNGNVGLHATRHNEYPCSHQAPDGEDRLMAVTAEQGVYEYRVAEGKLSDWSRRNPPSSLPRQFREARDRATGCVWDVSGERERLWLYGSCWLWMFDLSRDMPLEPDESGGQEPTDSVPPAGPGGNKKRKREASVAERQGSTNQANGAGGGKGRRRFKGETAPAKPDDDEGSDGSMPDKADADAELVRVRRARAEDAAVADGDGDGDEVNVDDDDDDDDDDDAPMEVDRRRRRRGPQSWMTHKYQPILGLVALGGTEEEDGASGLEVALVERPLWDVELKARWEGEQEWNRPMR